MNVKDKLNIERNIQIIILNIKDQRKRKILLLGNSMRNRLKRLRPLLRSFRRPRKWIRFKER